MNRGRILILGAGGHGKVAGDCAAESGQWTDVLFFDDRWPALAHCGPWAVAGRGADLEGQCQPQDQAFVAIGDTSARLAWLQRFRAAQISIATIVHPRAVVSRLAVLGAGTLVVAGAVVNADTRTGVGTIINTGATVDHDCELGDGVHIGPGAHLAGGVLIGPGSLVGIGAVVRQQIVIGSRVTVGAGAVVVKAVADDMTAVGVPAREYRPSPTKER